VRYKVLILIDLVWVHADDAVAKEADVSADKFLAMAQVKSVPLSIVDLEVWQTFVGVTGQIITQNKKFFFQAIDQPL